MGLPPDNGCTRVIIPESVAKTFESYMSIMEHQDLFARRGVVDLSIVPDDGESAVGNASVLPIQRAAEYGFGYEIRYEARADSS
jgi:hypothetical protein